MGNLSEVDSSHIWESIYSRAAQENDQEPLIRDYLQSAVFSNDNLAQGIMSRLEQELLPGKLSAAALNEISLDIQNNKDLVSAAAIDIQATLERDSACNSALEVFLFYKGFITLQAHRLAHELWGKNRKSLALLIQSHISDRFGIDIHPAAKIGRGIMLDHATGIVIGETAVIEDAVSIMQSVTLGGTGKQSGDRHPKIGTGVLIGPGAKILGNIRIGNGAMIAASSVVLKPVANNCIVAGVPAQVVGSTQTDKPSATMNHYFSHG